MGTYKWERPALENLRLTLFRHKSSSLSITRFRNAGVGEAEESVASGDASVSQRFRGFGMLPELSR